MRSMISLHQRLNKYQKTLRKLEEGEITEVDKGYYSSSTDLVEDRKKIPKVSITMEDVKKMYSFLQ